MFVCIRIEYIYRHKYIMQRRLSVLPLDRHAPVAMRVFAQALGLRGCIARGLRRIGSGSVHLHWLLYICYMYACMYVCLYVGNICSQRSGCISYIYILSVCMCMYMHAAAYVSRIYCFCCSCLLHASLVSSRFIARAGMRLSLGNETVSKFASEFEAMI